MNAKSLAGLDLGEYLNFERYWLNLEQGRSPVIFIISLNGENSSERGR